MNHAHTIRSFLSLGTVIALTLMVAFAASFGVSSNAKAQEAVVGGDIREAEMARCAAIMAVAAEKFVDDAGMAQIAENFNLEARRFLDEAVITEEEFQLMSRRGDVQMRTAFFRANKKTVNQYLQQCLPMLDGLVLYPAD